MRKKLLLKLLGVFVMLFAMTTSALAGGGSSTTYYSKVNATAKGPTGAGTVYVSKSNDSNGTYAATSSADQNSTKSGNHSYYLFHKVADHATFGGWFENESCTGTALSSTTVSIASNETESKATKNYYAKFTYKYSSQLTANAVGEGKVSVSKTDAAGEYAATVSANHTGDDSMADSESHSYNAFAQAEDGYDFLGWFSDEDCTAAISSEATISRSITATSPDAENPTVEQVYAKFAKHIDAFTFTVQANPSHITSIKGGTEALEETLSYSVDGVANTSSVAPYYNLQVTCVAGMAYSLKIYNGGELVSTLAESASGTKTYTVESETLQGATIVVDAREAFLFNLSADPSLITSIKAGTTSYEETLDYSEAGSLNASSNKDEVYNVQITGAADVYYSAKVYNASDALVSSPLHNVQGTQTFSVTRADLVDGRIEVTGVAVPAGVGYFILKANPEHITAITGGATSPYKTDNLNYSLEGEINLVPGNPSQYYIMPVLADNVIYDFERFAPGATTPEGTAYARTTVPTTGHMAYQGGTSAKNGRTVVLTSDYLLPAGTEWSCTVIGNPAHFTLRDNKNSNATMECSAEGVEYKSTQQLILPQIQPKDKNLVCNAYFFPAGADITDKSQAFDTYENITFSNTTSWKAATAKSSGIANKLVNGGTLLIESGIAGAGSITVNVEGDASKVSLKMGEESVGLSEGTNTIDLNSKYLIFSHTTKSKKFFCVTRNGNELTARAETGEGGGTESYSYNITNAADGDVYDIIVDYPAGPHNVYINVPDGCADFVQSVTVDDVETEWTPGEPLSIAGGKTVRVQGDVFGYIVNGTSINGEEKPVSASASLIIAGETTFDFDVTKIVRDKSFTFECKGTAKALLVTNLGSKMSVSAGTTVTVPLCDADNPIDFSASYVGSSQSEQAGVWRVNGTLAASGDIALSKFKVNDGDEINVEFVGSSSAPQKLNVTLGASGMYSYVGYLPLTFAEGDDADVKAYIATDCHDAKIKLDRVTGNIPAGTGLMLVGEANATVDISIADEGDASLVEDNLFTGVYKNEIIPGSGSGMYTYVFGTSKGVTGFWQLNGDKLCDNGNHAYLRSEQNLLPSAAKCLSLVFDDGDATGINGVIENTEDNTAIYNLAGQRVDAKAKGILIKNGKKVFVK